MLAATLGEWERAEEHFERAIELNATMDASTWLAHTQYEYARMLLRRGTERHDHAKRLLAEADRLAATIGMGALRKRIAMLGAPPAGSAGLPDGLSAREAQILRLVARGLSNREIGAELFISEHTAANHVRSILRKTGCANRTEAASYAHRHALVDARGPSYDPCAMPLFIIERTFADQLRAERRRRQADRGGQQPTRASAGCSRS